MPDLHRSATDSLLRRQQEITSILSSGVDRIADFQKLVLDTYARQTVHTLRSMQNLFPLIPPFIIELAERSIGEFTRMQNRFVDLAAKETHQFVGKMRPEFFGETLWTSRTLDKTTDRVAITQQKEIESATLEIRDYTDDIKRQASDVLDATAEKSEPEAKG